MMRAQSNDEKKYPQESMIKQKSNSQSNAQTVIVSKKVGFKTQLNQSLDVQRLHQFQYWLVALSLWCVSTTSIANEEQAVAPVNNSMWSRVQETLTDTWQSPNYELYIPVSTWHNRRYYDADKIKEFNEEPWGLGIGKYRYDEKGNWHALYGMAFMDSHNKLEPLVGYGYQKIWRPSENVRLGAGYSVGITMRSDFNYVPIPIIVPLASVEYKKLSVQSTYIPGGDGNGNILFTWLRWQLQ